MNLINIEHLTIECEHDQEHQNHKLHMKIFGPVSEQSTPIRKEQSQMIAVLTDSQQVDVTYSPPVDKKGKPAQLGSPVTWVTTDATVATVIADPANQFKATIVAGLAGVADIFPTADADLGDGVKTIEGEHVAVQVTSGQAVGFGSPVLGTPVEQP